MSIVDLPTELVLEIGRYLVLIDPPHCLLSFLSQTCRRFHHIFTHSIVRYHVRSISESPISKRLIVQEQTSISGSSTFSLDGDFKEMWFRLRAHTGNDIRCFRNLIFRANSISRIEVDVGLREASCRVLTCLLNTCVQRPNLHVKMVEHNDIGWPSRDPEGGPFTYILKNKFNLTATGPVKTSWKDVFLDALDVLSSKPRHKSIKGSTSPQIPPGMEAVARKPRFEVPCPRDAPRLTGLWMEGDYLFSASMYPWTRDIMNAAPLTHLSISHSTLTLYDWSQILSSITIPALTYLAIGRVAVAFPDLLDFFNRHPSLQVINLSDNELIGTVSFLIATPSRKSSLLPRLATLVATPEYIYPFMCHKQAGYFQQLNAFNLRPFPINFECKFRESRFHAIFELLASNPPTHLSIALSRTALNSLMTWFLKTSGHNSIVGRLRKLPGIWKLIIVGGSLPRQELVEGVRTLLEERAKKLKFFPFLNDVSSEPSLLDRLFHTICPDLQLIEYKNSLGYSWSMIT